jgi:hypothetical protein
VPLAVGGDVNDGQAAELKVALSAAYPQASDIQVTPEENGALIVISGLQAAGNSEAGHQDLRASIGNGDSPILRAVLSGTL